MKKAILYVGAALAMVFSLNSCNKEIQDPEEVNVVKQGTPFAIVANPVETRTENDGMSTKWVADDAINVFHAEAGTTNYVSDGQFTIAAADLESSVFRGTVADGALDADKSYDWYMFYPYTSQMVTPGQKTKGYVTVGSSATGTQTQSGNNSKAHLAGSNVPLLGKIANVSSTAMPSVSVNQACAFLEINVTNHSGSDLTVSQVNFAGTEPIVGTYYINFAGDNVVFTGSGNDYVSDVAKLTVSDGSAIANGGSANFYLAIKPFTAPSSGKLKISVNGYEKELTLSSDVDFLAGKIKKVNFNYDNTANNATFVFNTAEGLNDLGISKPASGNATNLNGKEVTSDGVSLAFAKGTGGTDIRIWNSNGAYDLRTYTGNSMTITAPDGYYISRILLEGNKPNGFSSNPSGIKSGTWVGEAQSVTLTATANGNINTITVSYEKAELVPTIVDKEIDNVAARGSEYTETISLQNFESAPSLSATVDGTVVLSASLSNITATSATVTYTVNNNTSGSNRTGVVTITDGSVSGTLTINQIADVFTVSSTEILLGAASGSQKTITVVSDYDWTVEDAMVDGFTVSPMQGEGSLNPVTLTITSTSANTNSSVIELGLFSIKRAVDNKETETITVSQSTNTSTTTLTVTMNDYVSDNDITVSSGSTIGDRVTSLSLNNVVTMSTTGNPNCGTFWGTSTIDWRLYQNQNGNVTISVSAGHKLVSVMFTYNSNNGGVLKDANLGNVNSNTEKAVSGTSITYTVGNTGDKTSGQVRITAVQVKYQ